MNRSERLLNLLGILRSYRYPVTGKRLAERLNISARTLYRDIATLQAQGAEIEGEAGVGYVLRSGFFIPPLMFSETEVEALMLGMLWVSTFADPSLEQAAESVLSKIRDVLPSSVKNGMGAVPLRVGPPGRDQLKSEDLSGLRSAIRQERKLKIVYRARDGKRTEMTVWPFAIGYFMEGRILVAWCEGLGDFGHFRTDRIVSAVTLNERYGRSRDSLFRQWRALQLKNRKSVDFRT